MILIILITKRHNLGAFIVGNGREEYQYRIFISYSHEDKDLVEKLVKVLKENGLNPVYDKHLEGGFGFTDQIKKFIAHALSSCR